MIKLTDILPDSLANDKKIFELAKTLDFELDKIHSNAQKVLHLPNLDNLPHEVLDHLAWQWHIEYYDRGLDIDSKRKAIRDSIDWHRHKGTPYALKKVLSICMKDAEIDEWFNYDLSKPYFFKIFSKGVKNFSDMEESLWRMIYAAKNVRSWLDNIEIDLTREYEDLHKYYHGVAEGIGGDYIHSVDSDIKMNHKMFVGIAEYESGVTNENIHSDFELNSKIYAGIADCIGGYMLHALDYDLHMRSKVYVGIAEFFAGYDKTDCERILDYVDLPKVPKDDDDDKLPGDYIRLYFAFDKGTRTITLINPRDDIQPAEILELSRYSVENKILLNSAGQFTTGISNAKIISHSRFIVI